jgi:hypothetical protein
MYPYPYSLWIAPMMTLGVVRQFRADLPPSQNFVTRRILFSGLNGCYYATPMGIFKLVHALDRIELFIRDSPREHHSDCYEEMVGSNPNTFF